MNFAMEKEFNVTKFMNFYDTCVLQSTKAPNVAV